ncbi:MAG: hypothetical protein JNJ88_18100 [Planctomycetes bacterium]|nr:hypothetical protein [Planctomycetota bacterium]
MKRVALFLALVVLGIIVLSWIDGSIGLFRRRPGRGGFEAPSSRPGGLTPISEIVRDSSATGASISAVEGLKLVKPGEPGKGSEGFEWHVDAGSARPTRDGYTLLSDCGFRFVEPATKRDLLDLRAKSGKWIFGGSLADPKLKDENEFELEEGVLRWTDALGRFPKLEATMATLSLVLRKQAGASASTKSPFQISGEGIRGSGSGFEANESTGLFRIASEPSLDVEAASGLAVPGKLRVKSRGAATLERAAARDPVLVTFRDQAVLRWDSADGSRFLEIRADELTFRLVDLKGTDGKGKLVAKWFGAKGNTFFRTEVLEGKCTDAEGDFLESGKVSEVRLNGPYRIDVSMRGGQSALPAIGDVKSLLISGSGTATATLVDARSDEYELYAPGRPTLSFVGPQAATPPSLTSELIRTRIRNGDVHSFVAEGSARVESPLGSLRGDRVELEKHGEEQRLVVTSAERAELDAAIPSKNSAEPPGSLKLFGRRIEVRPGTGREPLIRVDGAAHGETTGSRWSGTFDSDGLETWMDPAAGRRAKLLGNVSAQFVKPPVQAMGDRLELTEGSAEVPPRADLWGALAEVRLLEGEEVRQRARAPHLELRDQAMQADGPVEVHISASAIGTGMLASTEAVILTGSHLDTGIGPDGRRSSVTLDGPISSRGALVVEGDRLVLDFITNRHRLTAVEGRRAKISGVLEKTRTPFMAQAPRFDFDKATETVVLVGGGVFQFDGVATELRRPSPGSSRPGRTVRFEAAEEIRVDREGATFVGDVRVDSPGEDPWKLRSRYLDVRFDPKRSDASAASVFAKGSVVFDIGEQLRGNCDVFRYDGSTSDLVLEAIDGAEALLVSGLGEMRTRKIRFNTSTYAFETGAARLEVGR